MNGTGSTPPPHLEGALREFLLRFSGDRFRCRLDFNKQVQEAFGIAYGDQVVATVNDQGDIVLRRVDGENFGDPARSEKIAALRAAQRAHGLKEVESWNLLLKTELRLGLGTAPDHVMIPTALAADFAWWQRKKMARERRIVQRRIAAEALGVDVAGESAGIARARPRRLRRKA